MSSHSCELLQLAIFAFVFIHRSVPPSRSRCAVILPPSHLLHPHHHRHTLAFCLTELQFGPQRDLLRKRNHSHSFFFNYTLVSSLHPHSQSLLFTFYIHRFNEADVSLMHSKYNGTQKHAIKDISDHINFFFIWLLFSSVNGQFVHSTQGTHSK